MVEKHTLGDAPIEGRYRAKMQAIAVTLDEFFNGERPDGEARLRAWMKDRPVGFVLLVFPFGEGDATRCNFISNGVGRNDIVVLMKEMVARFEGQPDVKGRA